MPTYRLTIEYNGTEFHGWQNQPGERTIQSEIEEALSTVLRESISIVGSGRTDTGVHARGQVAHFTTPVSLETFKLLGSLNGLLRPNIAIIDVRHVVDGFHARYDARERIYHYQVSTVPRALDGHMRHWLRPAPDLDLMNKAAFQLLGEHNFSAFCRTASETRNRICRLKTAEWQQETRAGNARFIISADRFLHGMVRAIVGTLLQIGQKKRTVDDILRVLGSEDRREAGPAAPAKGLILHEVKY